MKIDRTKQAPAAIMLGIGCSSRISMNAVRKLNLKEGDRMDIIITDSVYLKFGDRGYRLRESDADDALYFSDAAISRQVVKFFGLVRKVRNVFAIAEEPEEIEGQKLWKISPMR
jgi:hypothetical protein